MKLFVLLSRVPFPLEKGDKLRAYHQIRLLAKKHEVYLFCLSDTDVSEDSRKELSSIVHHLEIVKLSKFLIGLNLIKGLFSSKPFQVHYFYQSRIQRKISRILNSYAPDHIYCQLIRCSEYVKNYHGCRKTLDYMDALNAGHRRRVDASKPIMKMLLREESKRLVAYENLVFDYFENQTIISRQDQQLIYHEQRNKIVVVQNGVDTDFFHSDHSTNRKFDLVFTGNMSYAPNIDGARRLVLEILPILQKANPDINVFIAGASPVSEVLELGNYKGVTVSGWMDDIRDAYNAARVFVAPMRIGSGLQNKILEGMSMGLPCVTTSLVANAFESNQRSALVVADSNADIANEILSLLNNIERSRSLAQLGEEMVKKSFSWQSTVDLLESLFIKK
jgi:sugar transferase (PEP-CTERM/EpsH1 system associated)